MERQTPWPASRGLTEPFSLSVGVHGCYDELLALLDRLGYAVVCRDAAAARSWFERAGRRIGICYSRAGGQVFDHMVLR